MSSEFEKVLNYSGITDEDLKQYSKADLYELKNSEIISVSVKAYYKDEYNNINTMTDTEIEEYYEEEFADDIGNTDGILQWFGILPYEVKAASDSDTTDGKMFTHKIVLTQASRASSGTVKVHLIYTGQWLEVPYYNSDDYIDLQLQNATFLKGYTYKYTYEYLESSLKYDINGNPVSGSETEPVRKSKTITIPTYVKLAFKETVVFQELAGGINGKIKSEFITDDCFSTCYIRQVQSHKFYFSIYAVLDNPNIKRIDASAYYYHLYKSSQIVPSLSVSAGTGGASISLGISASDKRKYKALGSVGEGNVLMTYIHYK